MHHSEANPGSRDDRERRRAPVMVQEYLPSWISPDDEGETTFDCRRFAAVPVDLTPMIDVTFLTLIFFMITASFDLQKVLDTSPAADEIFVGTCPVDQVNVEIDGHDQIFVDGNAFDGTTPEDLRGLLDASGNQIQSDTIRLLLHPESTHGQRVLVTDAASLAGFRKITPTFMSCY